MTEARPAYRVGPGTPASQPAPEGERFGMSVRLMRRASRAAVAVASVLVAAKTIAWLMTDSVAVLSSLVDSLLDVVASGVNLLAVRQALMPADREHRFGHGKAEPLAVWGRPCSSVARGRFSCTRRRTG